MATHQRRLTRPPIDERERELWIQHAAGLIIFEDGRNYAIEQLEAVTEINLADGDGMCMGFHGWKEGVFGVCPPMET